MPERERTDPADFFVQPEDGENMEAQRRDEEVEHFRTPQPPRRDFEACFICGKDLWSINTRHIGGHFMDYTCGDPIRKLLDTVSKHLVEQIAHMVKDHGFTPATASLRMGRKILDVKTMQDLEQMIL